MFVRALFSICTVLISLFSAGMVSAQTSCLAYPSNSTPPSGYAVSWDVYSPGKELLVQTNCPSSGTSLGLTVGKGDSNQIVYKISYAYQPGMTPPWQPNTLHGLISTGDWLTGIGTGALTAPLNASAANPFFFVGYVCTNRSGVWKCGCANTSCTTGKWQLQGYMGNGSGTTGGTTGGTGGTTGSSSGTISDVTFDNSTKRREAPGSDNWPVTWAADNNLYASWGDGGGFGGTNSDGRSNLGYARITGDWNNYVGHNVWGGKNAENPTQHGGYSYAIISIDGILYSWVLPTHSATDRSIKLYKSTNLSQTWTYTGLKDTDITNDFRVRTFINFGKDNQDAIDNYVYVTLLKGTDAYLMRVLKNKIEDNTAYEIFSGLSGGNPTWSTNFSNGRPTYTGYVHSRYHIAYIKGLNRFILMTNSFPADSSNVDPDIQTNFDLLEAPKPWGPWHKIKTFTNWMPPGSDPSNRYLFFFEIPGKWQSADGRDFTLIYTGTGDNDSWNTIRGHFNLQ